MYSTYVLEAVIIIRESISHPSSIISVQSSQVLRLAMQRYINRSFHRQTPASFLASTLATTTNKYHSRMHALQIHTFFTLT